MLILVKQSHSLLQKCAKLESVKGDNSEWTMTFYQALCRRGSCQRRQFTSPRGIVGYYTPHPTPAGYCFLFTSSRSHTGLRLNKSGYLPFDAFPSSWCQVRIPWFTTAFQNLQIPLWLGGYDGFCQEYETLCVGCHIYLAIADLSGEVSVDQQQGLPILPWDLPLLKQQSL